MAKQATRPSPGAGTKAKRAAGGRGQRHSSMGRSIAGAVVIKDEALFFLCQQDGRVPVRGQHGLGLYYHDARFLNGYEFCVADTDLNSLVASAGRSYRAVIQLTTPEIVLDDGTHIPRETIGVTLRRLLDRRDLSLHDVYIFENFGTQRVELPVAFRFSSRFGDVFQVRDLSTKRLGEREPPRWTDGDLIYANKGADGITRSTAISITPAPRAREDEGAHLNLRVDPQSSAEVSVSVSVREERDAIRAGASHKEAQEIEQIEKRLGDEMRRWLAERAEIRTDDVRLARVINRSLCDVHTLETDMDHETYLAAGVPWYVALFGRDSIIASLQMLAFHPERAEATLRLLAKHQGTKEDDWRDEEPGKILHELRVGELAHLDDIPQTPYYGTIDATPLFLMLLARHAHWTGSLHLFHDLRENVERALTWIDTYGDRHGMGYTAYEGRSKGGLANQGWKDSGDAIVNPDGSLARPPIALAEVQGYVYAAKREVADLFERAGEEERAKALGAQANELRERFNRDFWMDGDGTYALALEHGAKQVRSVASNGGQVLWSGIADDAKARQTAERLMRTDMFNGWGIRTLSANHSRYNPVGYHIGTVWPHDNSLIACGFRRYGLDGEANRIFESILDCATFFEMDRLPEVLSGFERSEYGRPVHYPAACHPQAWAAGSVPYMLTASLGLEADGFNRRLRVVDPHLPAPSTYVEIRRLAVAGGEVSLRLERVGERVEMHVIETRGDVQVTRLPRREPASAR